MFGRGNLQFVQTRTLFANNEIHKPLLLNSRAQEVSRKHERISQNPWEGPMQLHRLKTDPAEPHAMIEVSILLSVINQMGRNVASIFCHESSKTFLRSSWQPLAEPWDFTESWLKDTSVGLC